MTRKSNAINNSFSRFLGKVPLRVVFTVPFLLEVFVIVSLVGFLSYQNGKATVNNVAAQLREKISLEIRDYLDNYLATPKLVNELNADAIARGDLSLELPNQDAKTDYYLWQLMQRFDNLAWITLAYDGRNEYLGIQRLPENGELRFVVSNYSTDYLTVDYGINPQGERTKILREYPEKYDARIRPWYLDTVAAGKPLWAPIYPAFGYDIYFVDLSQPIYDEDGKLLGFISATYILDNIQDFLSQLKISPNGQTFIFDQEKLLVATSEKEQSLNSREGLKNQDRPSLTESNNPLIQATAKYLKEYFVDLNNIKINQSYQLEFNYNNERQFVQVYRYQDGLGIDWYIVTVVPESDFMEQIYAHTRRTILLCILALILVTIIGILTANWVTKPIATGASQFGK